MPGLSQLLETARRALMAQQVGIGVTSHNIANASTPGYSRQRVNLAATAPLRQSYGLLGTGVMAQHVGRLRDRFIDQQIRNSYQALGNATVRHQVLSQIEASFNEPSDSGLSAAMSRFFNAFQDLSVHPEESSSRNQVIQQGTQLSQTFHRLHGELTQLRGSLSDDVEARISRINLLAREISDLDVQISGSLAMGGEPSDAMDQRDAKLEELSRLANVTVSEDARGSVMVSIGGTVIASRTGAVAIKVQEAGGQLRIVTEADEVPVNVTAGELGGVLTLANETIPGQLAQLDQLANAIIARVNTLHRGGRGLGTPPPTGMDFFTGTGGADIAVSVAVASNTNNIAASADGTPGNNTVALALAGVAQEQLLNGNSLTCSQFYNGLISQLGSAINAEDTTETSHELILIQLEGQRAAVSGVSLDEEMTNLIKFQRSFDAAARLVNTANEMFQTVLEMV